MRINILLAIGAVCIYGLLGPAPSARSAYIETINESAAPATPNKPITHGSFDNIGWYYTPAVSYTLTGIHTVFGPAPGASGTNTITVQIQSERPASGGALLREATFQASQAAGGLNGGSFAPFEVTAGQKYFVNFLGVRGMGVNVGTWDFNANLTPQLSQGATTNLGAFYRDDEGLFAAGSTNPWGIADDGVTHISGSAPILLFEGFTVPEPSSLALMVAAGLPFLRRGAGGRNRTDTPKGPAF